MDAQGPPQRFTDLGRLRGCQIQLDSDGILETDFGPTPQLQHSE